MIWKKFFVILSIVAAVVIALCIYTVIIDYSVILNDYKTK